MKRIFIYLTILTGYNALVTAGKVTIISDMPQVALVTLQYQHTAQCTNPPAPISQIQLSPTGTQIIDTGVCVLRQISATYTDDQRCQHESTCGPITIPSYIDDSGYTSEGTWIISQSAIVKK